MTMSTLKLKQNYCVILKVKRNLLIKIWSQQKPFNTHTN